MAEQHPAPNLNDVENTLIEVLVLIETAYYPSDAALDYFEAQRAPGGSSQYEYDRSRALIRGSLEFIRQAQSVTEHLLEALRGVRL